MPHTANGLHVSEACNAHSDGRAAWHRRCFPNAKDQTTVTLTILVVDDELDLVGTYERLLRRVGHDSIRAYTGSDALALIDQAKPDLVVTDLKLLGVDGLAVARHARAHVPPIPVILITAYDSSHARSAAQESGVGAYLAKPFSNTALLDAVRRVLSPKPATGVSLGRS
jgi:two-component system response regulator GlrR